MKLREGALPWHRAVALGLTTIFGAWALFRFTHVTNEDAWISLKYARNLADGAGLVSNVGGPPEEGYSNLSWVLLLAFCRSVLRLDMIWASKVLGVLAVGGSVWASVRLLAYWRRLLEATVEARRSPVRSRSIDASGSIAFTVLATLLAGAILGSSYVDVWATQGLETAAYMLVVTATCLATTWVVVESRYRSFPWVAGLAFLGWTTRPEGAMNFAVALAVTAGWAYARGDLGRSTLLHLARGTACFGVLAVALLAWKRLYFGDVLANPSLVKLALARFAPPFDYVVAYFREKGLGFTAVATVSFVSTGAVAYLVRGIRAGRDLAALLVSTLAFVVSQLAFLVYSGGDYMRYSRFIVTHYPLLAFLSVVAPTTLVAVLAPAHARWAALVAAGATLWSASQERVDVGPSWYAVGFMAPGETHARQGTSYHLTAQALARFMRGTKGSYALSEYGYVPYHVPAPGLDMMGLNQKEVARNHEYYPLDEALRASRDFVLSRHPEIIVTGHYWRDPSGAIKLEPGVEWFFGPYVTSEFFLRNYTTDVPTERGHDWVFSFENGAFRPASVLVWANESNRDKFMHGFREYRGRPWAGPIARVLLRPKPEHRYLELVGELPDVSGYPEARNVIEVRTDDRAVGDHVFATATLTAPGPFRLRVKTDRALFAPGRDVLVSIRATEHPLPASDPDQRKISFAFEWIGFTGG